MAEGMHCYKQVLIFSAMVSIECVNVGLNTLFKAATEKGMSYHVFIVYAYAMAALLLLLPAPFFSYRSRVLPPLSFSILSKIGLLGVIGSCGQIMGYAGINYSSPTLASAIGNLTPAFTFILAIIFRMERVAMKKSSSQAKVIGTIVSITGALVVALYRGPPVSASPLHSVSLENPPISTNPNWILGSFFLTVAFMLATVWYIVQTHIMKEYPAELTVVCLYNFSVSVIAAIVALITEGTSDAWIVRPNVALLSIVCSGLFESCLYTTVHTWALKVKGPVFVAMFRPLSIVIAVAMGAIFLGETLHLGTVIGATAISVGFYSVMWGKAKEEYNEEYRTEDDNMESHCSQKAPLLLSFKSEHVQQTQL